MFDTKIIIDPQSSKKYALFSQFQPNISIYIQQKEESPNELSSLNYHYLLLFVESKGN